MKVIHIDQNYQYGGGTEHYILAMTEELEKLGHEVIMLYGRKGNQTIDRSRRRTYHIPHIEDYYPRKNRSALKKLEKIIEKENPDIIHIHNLVNELVVKTCLNLTPTLRHVQDPTFTCFRHWKLLPGSLDLCTVPLGLRCIFKGCLEKNPVHSIYQIIRKYDGIRIHKKVDQILVSSSYVKWMLLQLGLPREKITVIHPFTKLPDLGYDSFKDQNIVLFIGKMHPIKGVDHLLHALSLINTDYKAVLIGNGEYLEEYKALAIELGLEKKVDFLGWVPLERLDEFYRMCSILVVPSIWVETFGLIGIDAMSYGKPVVGFDVGGIPDWLTDRETGYLVKRKDIKGLAEKINLILQDKELAKRMGKSGRLRVEQSFTSQTFIKNLIGVYNSVTHSK